MNSYRLSTATQSSSSSSSRAKQTSFTVEGVGIHTGRNYRVQVSHASKKGQGVMFHHQRDEIVYSSPAFWLRVSGTSRATALVLRGDSKRRFELMTVEHFLAAALMRGFVDLDVTIECLSPGDHDSLEFPVLDGSAAQWTSLLNSLSDPDEISSSRTAWKLIRSLEVRDQSKSVVLLPSAEGDESTTHYHTTVDFGGTLQQSASLAVVWTQLESARHLFESTIAPARTFGFKKEIDALIARGLALGGSLENAILLDGSQVVNPEGFRFPNELAAHKLMDAIGDFALLGGPLLGRIEMTQAGHSMHLRAIEEAFRTGCLVKGLLHPSGSFERA